MRRSLAPALRPSECDDLGLLKDLGEHVPGGLALQVNEDVRRVIPAMDFEPDIQHCLDRCKKIDVLLQK